MGVGGEVRDALDDDDGEPSFAVWPENVHTLGLFRACHTQWRVGAMGGVLGLDYAGVEVVLRMMRVKKRNQVFGDLQVMEAAALPILNERHEA